MRGASPTVHARLGKETTQPYLYDGVVQIKWDRAGLVYLIADMRDSKN